MKNIIARFIFGTALGLFLFSSVNAQTQELRPVEISSRLSLPRDKQTNVTKTDKETAQILSKATQIVFEFQSSRSLQGKEIFEISPIIAENRLTGWNVKYAPVTSGAPPLRYDFGYVTFQTEQDVTLLKAGETSGQFLAEEAVKDIVRLSAFKQHNVMGAAPVAANVVKGRVIGVWFSYQISASDDRFTSR